MSLLSDEDTDISDSELSEYAEEYYERLVDGSIKVKLSDGVYRCPFCPGEEKLDYKYKELLQHASGVGEGSQERCMREKGKHLGLARYMEEYLDGDGLLPKSTTEASQPLEDFNLDELFVWPWVGIVANIHVERKDGKYVGESGSRLREDLARQGFNPVRVHSLWNYRGHSGFAVIEFNKDWSGFINAVVFEKSFEADHRGKRGYFEANSLGDGLYGWIARADDFHSENIVGEYLRKSGDLKTIADIESDDKRKTEKLVLNLTNEIQIKSKHLREIECKYNETSMSLGTLMAQKDAMHKAYNEEISKMQQNARSQLENILKEHERIALQLEAQSQELKQREKELERLEAQNENERKKFFEDKTTNERATLEQKKADENVLRLAEEQKREKERLRAKIIELQKKLDAKQALELEVQRIKGALQVMKHMDDGGDTELKDRMNELQQNLLDKEEDLQSLDATNQALIVKERKCNDELQEARKELINGLNVKEHSNKASIGVKQMGLLDPAPFHVAAKRKYCHKEADLKAMELRSLWENYLRDPNWYPFKITKITTAEGNDKEEEIIDEDDSKLKYLKSQFGDALYLAVVTALLELNDHDVSGRYPVPELWNYEKGRKARLVEGLAYVVKQLRVKKGKRN